MSTTFLAAVNRIFRANGIIRGDTDPITTFSDTAHNASIQVATIAVQDELASLVSDKMIPAERLTSATISTTSGTRTYALASDFIRFYGTPHLYCVADNTQIYEYPGGLPKLQTDIFTYATDPGDPINWYFEPGPTNAIGFWQVPNSVKQWVYEYEASVLVSASSDTLPFNSTEQDYAFTGMCARRFKYMFEDVKNEADIQAILDKDRTYLKYRATLLNLIKGRNATKKYGYVYA